MTDSKAQRPGQGLSGSVDGHQVLITGRTQALARGHVSSSDLPEAKSGLECLIFIDGVFTSLFRFHDQPRAESQSFIGHLGPQHQAEQVILLSGDRHAEVEHLAPIVGIQQIKAGASPEEKLRLVKEKSAHYKVLFVGDGINDAPAMLAATSAWRWAAKTAA